jgi:peptidyl-prolyl cis-trans isomerase B (cyclophilin B)
MHAWLIGVALIGSATWAGQGPALPRVRIETNRGTIVVELEPDKAPKTVANFLAYVRAGFYDGTIFHRVIPGFMAQGGGFTADFERKPTRPPIENEAGNGLSNRRGTVAMARTADVDSATSQFFINLVDNTYLDHRDSTPRGFGYCVFGRVVEGMDVVDAIAAIPTGPSGPFPGDVPTEPVVIVKTTVTN